jgi:MOSC domain-containing protein YiiM
LWLPSVVTRASTSCPGRGAPVAGTSVRIASSGTRRVVKAALARARRAPASSRLDNAGPDALFRSSSPGASVSGPFVTAVAVSASHSFTKSTATSIRLIAGLGVEGDAHAGVTVKHRSRARVDPTRPNLRQVHLIHAELHDELVAHGFPVTAGRMGENVTTRGLDLLGLPTGARLRLGAAAVVEVTGLRNPCSQLDGLHHGLMAATLDRDAQGRLVRKAGVMAIVLVGGEVRPGDPIAVELPAGPHAPLAPV